jgi:hypothetical protein
MHKRFFILLAFCLFSHFAHAGKNEGNEERYSHLGTCEGSGIALEIFEVQWYDHFRGIVERVCRYEVVATSPNGKEKRYVVNKKESSFYGNELNLEKQAGSGQFTLSIESHQSPIPVSCNFGS